MTTYACDILQVDDQHLLITIRNVLLCKVSEVKMRLRKGTHQLSHVLQISHTRYSLMIVEVEVGQTILQILLIATGES